jgi:hypothetical protein
MLTVKMTCTRDMDVGIITDTNTVALKDIFEKSLKNCSLFEPMCTFIQGARVPLVKGTTVAALGECIIKWTTLSHAIHRFHQSGHHHA